MWWILIIFIIGWAWFVLQSTPEPHLFQLAHIKSQLQLIAQPWLDEKLFQVVPSTTKSYIEDKFKIHLVPINSATGKYFSNSTLLSVGLHEMSHLLTPGDSNDHGPVFQSIERQLTTRAIELGWLDSSDAIDRHYPGC